MITLHGLSLSLALMFLMPGCAGPDKEGEPPLSGAAPLAEAPSPAQSAALFIGVGKFDHNPEAEELPYTVNDSLELAKALIEHRLLSAENVRLLLAGTPSGASRRTYYSMSELIGSPTKAEIKSALQDQASKVGPEGILYVFIATHGYSIEGQSYVMAKDSIPDSPRTAVSASEILAATQGSKGRRTLFLDTCRVIESSSPQGSRSPTRGAKPAWQETLAKTVTSRSGYAVFFATGPGGIAKIDPERQNGIFTGAILDALRCKNEDATAEPRMVGLSDLSPLVQDEVSERSDGIQSAELLLANGFQNFLLFRCGPIGEILEPREHGVVQPSDAVLLQVSQQGLYPRVVVQAESNGVFYVQKPQRTIPAVRGEEVRLPVDYGSPDRFQVYVGLGEAAEFLDREETQIPWLLETDREGRRIRWLGPVHVTLPKTE